MQPPPNERELIERAKKGDREAVSMLYEAYAQAVFRYISYRVQSDMIAEDLTADVFLRMVRSLPEYKYTGAPFGAWLFRIAANRITDYRRERHIPDEIPEQYSDSVDLQAEFEREEEQSRLRVAIQALPEDYQAVLILRFMQDLSHADVASAVGKSVEAVRVLQHRALKALGKALNQQSSIEGVNSHE
jgi:RNA polymerase sigma-70 factor, ECF subfamily